MKYPFAFAVMNNRQCGNIGDAIDYCLRGMEGASLKREDLRCERCNSDTALATTAEAPLAYNCPGGWCTECVPCNYCGLGSYRTQSCQNALDTQCSACDTCALGWYVENPCHGTRGDNHNVNTGCESLSRKSILISVASISLQFLMKNAIDDYV